MSALDTVDCAYRLDGDEIAMTHQEISIMLGVRRASAADVLHVLEGQRAIWSERGRIVVRDRALLEEIAGETYGDAEADYRRLIGPFGKPASAGAQRAVPDDRQMQEKVWPAAG